MSAAAMAPRDAVYLPVGSLSLFRSETGLSPEQWLCKDLRSWSFLTALTPPAPPSLKPHMPKAACPVSDDVQNALLRSGRLNSIKRLLRVHWILAEFRVFDQDYGSIHVYLLADDVLRSTIDRSDSSLRKARLGLMQDLDYSQELWNAENEVSRSQSQSLSMPMQSLSSSPQEESSLLKLFNNIPSPEPNPADLYDASHQHVMLSLLDSKVRGLKTTLYPYQGRSAALMLQKEVQPSAILDPRLIKSKDCLGSTFYMDPIGGSIFREPRHYDGVSGGILAEEMGAGKTIICLALILATVNFPSITPDVYRSSEPPRRQKIGSLMQMAASAAVRNSVPWKTHFDVPVAQGEGDFVKCREILEQTKSYYRYRKPVRTTRKLRTPPKYVESEVEVLLSSVTLIVVPNNLLAQWNQEIRKHTTDLRVLVIVKDDEIPAPEVIYDFDIVLFSQSRFEKITMTDGGIKHTPLFNIHFKRCIVDEGHKLGNSRMCNQSNLLKGLDGLHITSRWIVTGTPSHGLFGVDQDSSDAESPGSVEDSALTDGSGTINQISADMERKDLQRLGSITALYLKARPWARTNDEDGDSKADWNLYLMLPRHGSKSHGRMESLEMTLNSLIIRHQLSDIRNLLPRVKEETVVLEGSYQDQLSQNVFDMMIILNAVQSQRTDADYFFHPGQRSALMQLVTNLKQASFFGGAFFATGDILMALKTAQQFLDEAKVPISAEDASLLRDAIGLGQLAAENRIRSQTTLFHDIAVTVAGMPESSIESWSTGGSHGEMMCTSSSMLLALQKCIFNATKSPEKLNSLLNGGLASVGRAELLKLRLAEGTATAPRNGSGRRSGTLAGNTKLGKDSHKKARSHGINGLKPHAEAFDASASGPLDAIQITSTVSAKLSYLVDGILLHQDEDKILVFYENDNVAWYIATMLDVLQVKYLIYAKGLTTERRAQYVKTFHSNETFRVLLMDLSQAAFGLDMKAASRIYFVNPVLNPQVQAQAIGRVRRIGQAKPVFVETLVLKGSIDEVIVERREHMSQAEHHKMKTILDDQPIYNWIKNAKISPLPESDNRPESQMTQLRVPQQLFRRGYGEVLHPDDGLEPESPTQAKGPGKRPREEEEEREVGESKNGSRPEEDPMQGPPARRIRFADD